MFDSLVKLYDEFSKGSRVQDLAQLAKEHKFNFTKRQSFGQQKTEIKTFKIFKKKGTSRILGLMQQKTEGFTGNIRFYDYLNTKDLETKTQSIVEVYCEQLFAENLRIEPKSTFSKMKGFFTSAKNIFPQLTDFHQQFQISYEDAEATLILNESALDLMIDFPGITIECSGNLFLFYYRKKEIPLLEIIPLIDFAEEFIRRICFDRTEDYV